MANTRPMADLWEHEFMPAMKDGQPAWVLNGGNLLSKQWVKDMPPSTSELPLPEIALVTGVSDREGLSMRSKHSSRYWIASSKSLGKLNLTKFHLVTKSLDLSEMSQ